MGDFYSNTLIQLVAFAGNCITCHTVVVRINKRMSKGLYIPQSILEMLMNIKDV